MKHNLVKREDRWDLYDEKGQKYASSLQGSSNMLSLKNCEAIERGYDLDELAMEECNNPDLSWENDYAREKFKAGFQKALELMGDKKFSMRDMNTAFRTGHSLQTDINLKKKEYKPSGEFFKELIQSLQQTEWNVEIETIEYGLGNDKDGRPVYENRCLLDSEGCLILKRVK